MARRSAVTAHGDDAGEPGPSIPPFATVGRKRESEAGESPLILIVDDNEDNRDLYGTYLSFAGFRVDLAVDGEAALSATTREAPALVVMDLTMPRLDGWQATRRLKSNPRTKVIPIIVLTAHCSKEVFASAKGAGADLVLTKPCLPAELLVAVEKLLRDRSG